MSFDLHLTEDLALPNATRVFIGSSPRSGTLGSIAFSDSTPQFAMVTSVRIDDVEYLARQLDVDTLLAAQRDGSLVYGPVAPGAVITVHIVGDVSRVRASVT